jgi:putative transposase
MASTIASCPRVGNTDFQTVLEPFLQSPGLAFAEVLSASEIEQAFAERDALFGWRDDEIFSTPIVLWAFLAQTLRDGKGAACAAAVADIATHHQQTNRPTPCGDTGDYCRARAKRDLDALWALRRQTARRTEHKAKDAWRWHGRCAKLVDGFTFTMPDTPENQRAFPQQGNQAPGVGLPIARACAILSLSTASIHDLAIGPYQGKQTGETALLRTILDTFDSGDVAVFDRYYGSYMMIALLQRRGVDVCARVHQCRHCDFRRGRRLGDYDHLVSWTRPARPAWMAQREYEQIPETMTLRELQFEVTTPGCRTETITVVTTLLDPQAYPKEDIADVYGYRWNAELDIRDIKQTLGLDHVRCKTPAMVRREVQVTLLAYNLIRGVIVTAAMEHNKQPRQIGFTLTCQTILSSWMLLATGTARDAKELTRQALQRIAKNKVANRPGRIEPRVLKRRRHRYPLMQKDRTTLRTKRLKEREKP